MSCSSLIEMASLRRAACLALTLALGAVAVPAVVSAQPAGEPKPVQKEPTKEELAAARALFDEALVLERDEKWSEALEKLERVGKVKMTPQVRFHIALCHENLGRLVDAINGFELAVQEARAVGAKDVMEAAPPRAEKLRARVAQLTFSVEGTVRSSKVFIDGEEVSLALADTKIPIDPGEHLIEVRRDGKVTERREILVDEGETQTIRLRIDDPEPPPPPDPPPPPPDPVVVTPEVPPEDESVRIPAYVVAGVGVAGLLAAGVLWGLRESSIAKVRCDDPEEFTGCDPRDVPFAEEGERLDVASKVMVGVGGAALVTGVVLWFVLAPDDAPPKSGATRAVIDVGPSGAYGALRISF
jgi:hypothetical protein